MRPRKKLLTSSASWKREISWFHPSMWCRLKQRFVFNHCQKERSIRRIGACGSAEWCGVFTLLLFLLKFQSMVGPRDITKRSREEPPRSHFFACPRVKWSAFAFRAFFGKKLTFYWLQQKKSNYDVKSNWVCGILRWDCLRSSFVRVRLFLGWISLEWHLSELASTIRLRLNFACIWALQPFPVNVILKSSEIGFRNQTKKLFVVT